MTDKSLEYGNANQTLYFFILSGRLLTLSTLSKSKIYHYPRIKIISVEKRYCYSKSIL